MGSKGARFYAMAIGTIKTLKPLKYKPLYDRAGGVHDSLWGR